MQLKKIALQNLFPLGKIIPEQLIKDQIVYTSSLKTKFLTFEF